LQNDNIYVVCWSPDHKMYSCPDRSAAMKAIMGRKQYISHNAGSLAHTKLKLQDSKKSCLKLDCHIVAPANMQKNSNILAYPVANGNPRSMSAGPTRRERLPEAQITEDMAGTEQSSRHTEEQQQHLRRDIVVAHTQIGTELDATSACAHNQNLLMLGLGKNKLKTTH